MNVLDIRRVRLAGLASFLMLAILAISASISSPAMAATGVSGQIGNWENIEFGEGPGQLLYPTGYLVAGFGVDQIDGSTYILTNNLAKTQATIDKFTSAGVYQGSAAIPRASSPGGAGVPLGITGIAVDHKADRLYVVTSEYLESSPIGEAYVAQKLLAYSTEASGGQLALKGTSPLPGPTEAGAIFTPVELHADETSGELVLSGVNPAGKPLLQRLSPTGVEGKSYAESGNSLKTSYFGLAFSFDVAQNGTTYVLANAGSEAAADVQGFTLPAKFQPSSGALTLAPIPGFAAAAAAEGWGKNTSDYSAETVEGLWGPQVALVTAPDGEETLYWKAFNLQEPRSKILIHGFSIQQGATTPAFGGGSEEPECAIEGRGTALAATTDGDLTVFDQGQQVSGLGSEPAFGPSLYRFGAGGGECPDPAPLAKLTVAGQAVSTVAPGTSVTLDGAGSEAGESTIASALWIIKGPGGTETVPGSGSSLTATHTFSTVGTYTVSLQIKTAAPVLASAGSVGNKFIGKPVKLTVSSAGAELPTITKIEPTSGPATGQTAVKVTGQHLTGATAVEFGTAAGTVTKVTDTEIVVSSPAGTVGSKVAVKVTTAGGSATSTEKFEWTAVPAPVVTGISPTKGPAAGGTVVKVTGEHLTGTTAVEFGTAAGTVTKVTDTEITVTSPAGTGGTKAAVKVTTPGGSATSTAQFEWEVVPPIVKRKLTISKGGVGSGSVLCDGGACAAEYVVGTTVTLTAAADTGSTFGGWSGGGCSGTAPCKVVIGATDITVAALFNKVPPPSGGGNNNPPPGNSTPPPVGPTKPTTKTPAQKLQEKRQKAIAKCKKKTGKAKAQCLKKAHQIGKPTKKPKAKK